MTRSTFEGPRTYTGTSVEIFRLAGEGFSHSAIARHLRVTRQRVSQVLRPVRVAARQAVVRAIERGLLVRPSVCEDCGDGGEIEAHHDNYDKPLDVRWLCVKCHSRQHRNAGLVKLTPAEATGRPYAAIPCPECGGECETVVDTRKHNGHVRRRRVCSSCGSRVTTYEQIVAGPQGIGGLQKAHSSL